MKKKRYAGSDWVKRQSFLKNPMSPLGENVADALGLVFRGIYHLSETSLRKVNWSHPSHIRVVIGDELANVDYQILTEMVVVCNYLKLRFAIRGIAPGYVKVIFHQRQSRNKEDFFNYIPPLDQQIQEIREFHGIE